MIRPNRFLASAVGLAAFFFATGVARSPAAASDGATTRIVSLVPSVTETLFALGAQDQIVGVSDYCRYPEAARNKPAAGALLNPTLEKILLLRPTLVLLYSTQSETAEKLKSLGVPAKLLAADRMQDVFDNLETLGELTGRRTQAQAAASALRSRLKDVERRAAAAPRVTALLVVSRDPAELRNIYVSTPSHYLGELLALAGGENVVGRGAPAALSKERIVRADPEVLLDFSPAEHLGADGRPGAAAAAWNQLSTRQAVRKKRVRTHADPHALVPGISAGSTAETIFAMLHGAETP